MSEVDAVHREAGFVLLDTGETVLITNWFDEDGDECERGDAVAAVAGPDAIGGWYAVDLAAFVPMKVN